MNEAENVKYWLWLEMIYGIANVRLLEYLEDFPGPKELFYALHDPDCNLLNDKERQRVRTTPLSKAEAVLGQCEKNGIGIMTWDSALYPESLRHIYNPPVVLFYRGNPVLLHEKLLLTVVGTRRASEYSIRIGKWLCSDLAKCNMILVSGCAVGLDALAHRAALEEGKPTIGVMGCGLDYDYPKENRALKAKIVENGLLLSEYFPGTPPNSCHFPVRNRILSGISSAVLVLEAGAKSGALITANLACEQEKYVFCVPPADLLDPRYSGVAGFLRDGAYPVFNYLDILYVYYMQYPHKITLFDAEMISRSTDSLLFHEAAEKSGKPHSRQNNSVPKEENSAGTAAPAVKIAAENPSHQKILDVLESGGKNMNTICLLSGFSFEETSMLIMEMEMLGYVVNTERDIFALAEDAGAV